MAKHQNRILQDVRNKDASTIPGSLDQRLISTIIHEYLNRDFGDAENQRALFFPDTWEKHQLRVTPFIHRVAVELSTLYRQEPRRRLADLSDAQATLYLEALRDGDATASLATMNDHGVVLQQAYAIVMPAPERRGVSILVVPMHDVFPVMSSPTSSSVAALESVTIRVDEPSNNWLQAAPSWAEITKTSAKWVRGPRKDQSFFDGCAGVNPLGVIPLLAVRARMPVTGSFLIHVPEDLLHGQRAMDRAWTSLLHTADTQGFSQPVLTLEEGPRIKGEILEVGMETALRLRIGESFVYATPDADLTGYLAQLRAYIEVETAMVGLNPATFLKSSAITGVARLVEMWDRSQERKKLVRDFERSEQDLYRYTAGWLNHLYGNPVLPLDARVSVEWVVEAPPSDPLHEAQRDDIRIAQGLESPVRVMMREQKLTREEALEVLKQNLADRELAQWRPQGTAPPDDADKPAVPDAAPDQATEDGAGDLAVAAAKEMPTGIQLDIIRKIANEDYATGALTMEGAIAYLEGNLGMDPAVARKYLEGVSLPKVKPAADAAA